MIAKFLGWTREHPVDGDQPNPACDTAFDALDLIDQGLLAEADLRGLTRAQLAELVKGIKEVHRSNLRHAKQEAEEAEIARKRAAAAEAPAAKARYEAQAAVRARQAEQARAAADAKAAHFAQDGANLYRDDRGRAAVRARADELKSSVERPVVIHDVDDLAKRVIRKLLEIREDSELAKDLAFLKRHVRDLSVRQARELSESLGALADWLRRRQRAFENRTGSHTDETGDFHVEPKRAELTEQGNGQGL
jgi:hypothetical protein